MPRSRITAREIGWAVAKAVAALLLVEGALRLLAPGLVGLTFYALPPAALAYHQEHPALFWYRPRELGQAYERIAAYRGKNLVVTLGGSVAEGWQGHGFAEALEARLAPRFPGYASVPLVFGGYTTYHSRILLDEVLRRGTPRVVVVCNMMNDQTPAPIPFKEVGLRNRAWTRRVLFYRLNRLKTFVVLRRGAEAAAGALRRQSPAKSRTPAVPLADYADNLDAMARRCAERGCALVLVSEPTPACRDLGTLADYEQALREAARRNPGVYFADVRARFDEERRRLGLPCLEDLHLDVKGRDAYQDALFTDSCCHLTWRGVGVMADPVERVLLDNHLLAE